MIHIEEAQKELFDKVESWLKKWDMKFGEINVKVRENKTQYVQITFAHKREELLK